MPSIVQCTLGTTALTFSNVATEDDDGNKVTTDSCGVAANYQQVTKVLLSITMRVVSITMV